jgi:hypothetical protein
MIKNSLSWEFSVSEKITTMINLKLNISFFNTMFIGSCFNKIRSYEKERNSGDKSTVLIIHQISPKTEDAFLPFKVWNR